MSSTFQLLEQFEIQLDCSIFFPPPHLHFYFPTNCLFYFSVKQQNTDKMLQNIKELFL